MRSFKNKKKKNGADTHSSTRIRKKKWSRLTWTRRKHLMRKDMFTFRQSRKKKSFLFVFFGFFYSHLRVPKRRLPTSKYNPVSVLMFGHGAHKLIHLTTASHRPNETLRKPKTQNKWSFFFLLSNNWQTVGVISYKWSRMHTRMNYVLLKGESCANLYVLHTADSAPIRCSTLANCLQKPKEKD